MFQIRDLVFRYPGAPRDAPPTLDLSGVDLEVDVGTLVLLGESGSGKTTLLNLLGLLWDQPPDSGEIVRGGAGGGDAGTPRGRAKLRCEEYGFVLQSSFLLPHFSVERNIAVPLELAGLDGATIRRRVDVLLKTAGMSAFARRKARDLSGGQKQRVAVLRALVHGPRVVFADEPVSSLDRQNASLVLGILQGWREGTLGEPPREGGRILIVVSHNLRQSRAIAGLEGKAVILFGGRVVGGRSYRLASLDDDAIYEAIEAGHVPSEAIVAGSNGEPVSNGEMSLRSEILP